MDYFPELILIKTIAIGCLILSIFQDWCKHVLNFTRIDMHFKQNSFICYTNYMYQILDSVYVRAGIK